MKTVLFSLSAIIIATIVSIETQNSINDVDWGMMENVLTTYFCKGNESWIQSLKMHGSPKYLQLFLSLQNIILCQRLSINLIKSVYKNVFRDLITTNRYARNCYKEGFSILLTRIFCCKGVAKSVNIFATIIFKELKCGQLKGYLCTAVKYGKRRDVVLQAYHLFSKLRFCNGCYRRPFNHNVTSCGPKQLQQQQLQSRRRQKRFYDLSTWLYTIRTIVSLDTHNISLKNDNYPGARLRRNMFIGEGLMQCIAELSYKEECSLAKV